MTYPEIVEIIGSEGELVVGPDPYKVRQVRKTQFYWLDAEPHLKGVKFTFVDISYAAPSCSVRYLLPPIIGAIRRE